MLTQNHKDAISNGMKRFFLNGGKSSMIGKKHSEETKKRMSQSHIGVVISESHKDRLRFLKTGKSLTESHKKSLCIAQKNRFMNGGVIWNKGIILSKQHIKNLIISHIGKTSRKKICKIESRSEYAYLHNWVKKNLIKIECLNCKTLDNLQYANKSGLYKKEISDWIILCRLCHARYDQSFTPEEIRFGRVT